MIENQIEPSNEREIEGIFLVVLDALLEARYARYREYGAFTTADLPVRERRERQNLVDRLRALLDSGRPVLAVGEGGRLAPVLPDDEAATQRSAERGDEP